MNTCTDRCAGDVDERIRIIAARLSDVMQILVKDAMCQPPLSSVLLLHDSREIASHHSIHPPVHILLPYIFPLEPYG